MKNCQCSFFVHTMFLLVHNKMKRFIVSFCHIKYYDFAIDISLYIVYNLIV